MHSCEARAVLRGFDTKPAAHAALPGPAEEPAGGGAGVGIPVTAAGLEQPARRHLPEPGRPPPHRGRSPAELCLQGACLSDRLPTNPGNKQRVGMPHTYSAKHQLLPWGLKAAW